VLAGVAAFWSAILVAAALEPGYSNRRDYVSTLAANGADHGELAVLGILAAAGSMIAAAVLVRPLSVTAAIAVGVAGIGFVIAAFTRLECPDGAAGCGLGGRFEISGSTEIGHWTATTLSSILLIGGMAIVGVTLVRRGRPLTGIGSLAAAAFTAGAFLATGGDDPGGVQRVGIVVATGWLAAVALVELAPTRSRLRILELRKKLEQDGPFDVTSR
jgi:Protein of unknown function (DUF998)